MTPGDEIGFRVVRLESEQERQRTRTHELAAEIAANRLLLQRTVDAVEHLAEDGRALKRAFYSFAIATVGSAIVFAFAVFALLGKH